MLCDNVGYWLQWSSYGDVQYLVLRCEVIIYSFYFYHTTLFYCSFFLLCSINKLFGIYHWEILKKDTFIGIRIIWQDINLCALVDTIFYFLDVCKMHCFLLYCVWLRYTTGMWAHLAFIMPFASFFIFVFSIFFFCREHHQKSLISDILSIMSHILHEEASEQLLDVILRNLLKEDKASVGVCMFCLKVIYGNIPLRHKLVIYIIWV